MIRILIVDDHPVVRQGLLAVLDNRSDFELVGSCASGDEVVTAAARLDPDVILLDLEMPGTSGLEALQQLAQSSPRTQVLIFTAYDTHDRVEAAIRAGARGYLLKGAPADEIARAVHVVHAGGFYLEPRVAAKLVPCLAGKAGTTHTVALTPRERQVISLIAGGLSNKQIARSLAITERTVKFHVASIFEKLDVENRAQAVAVAAERGVL